MTLALIDADIVAFRSSAAVQTTTVWDEETTSVSADPERAAEEAIATCLAWAEGAHCRDIRLFFTGPSNFRKRVLPTYKGNRVVIDKPLAYASTVQAMQARFQSSTVNGLEADDLLGILLTTPGYEDSVCITLDKDLNTVPGKHYNPNKDTRVRTVGLVEADYYHLMQTLTGDTTDHYAGCPGMGAERAAVLLNSPVLQVARQHKVKSGPRKGTEETRWSTTPTSSQWAAVVSAYAKAGLTEADALVQARVARILRRSDYDHATRTIRLWHPYGEGQAAAA